MTKVWRFIRKWWWVFLAAAGAILAIVWRIMASKPAYGERRPDPPVFAERAKEEAERIRLEGEVEKARVTATAEARHEEINRIEELGKSNPTEARRQMADWLTRNL